MRQIALTPRDTDPDDNGFVMATNRRKFKVTKPFIARVAAVVLFVCLGTFAVVQSIQQSKKKTDASDDTEVAQDTETEKDNQPDNSTIQGAIADNIPQISAKPTAFTQEEPNNKSPQQAGGGFEPGVLPKSNELPPISSPDQNTLTDNTQQQLPIQQFPDQSPQNQQLPDQTPPLIETNPPENQQQFGTGQFGSNNSIGDQNKTETGAPQGAPQLVNQQDQFGDLPKTSIPGNQQTQAPKQFELPSNPVSQNLQTQPATQNQSQPKIDSFGDTQPDMSTVPSTPVQQFPPEQPPVVQQTPKSFNELPQQTAPINQNNGNFSQQTPAVVSSPQKQQELQQNNLRSFPDTNQVSSPQVSSPQKLGPNHAPNGLSNQLNPSLTSDTGSSTAPTQQINTIPSPITPATPPINNIAVTGQSFERLLGVQAPSLTLQKLAPRETSVNQPADFRLVVRNVGKTIAENVIVYDQIPNAAQVVSLNPQPTSQNGKTVSWNLGAIEPGGQKTIDMKLKPTAPGEMGSVAQVTFTAKASSRTKITRPELKLQHSAPQKTLVGRDVILDITIQNTGDGPARNVVIQESVPPNLKSVINNKEEKEIEYLVGTLRPGQRRNLKLRLRASQVGHVRNLLVAHADGDLRTQHAIEMDIVAPEIGVTANGPNRRFLGRPAKHEFSVRNTGTAAATNVLLVAKLPRGLKFASANHHGQYNPNAHSVVWSLEKLDPGVMGKVQLTTTPVENGNQSIEFSARSDNGKRQAAQTTVLVYQVAELHFTIDDLTDALEVGTETTYRVRVVNQGSKAAKNVRLAVQFPAGIKPIQIDGVNNPNLGQTVALPTIQTLGPRQQRQFQIRARGVAAGDHRVIATMASDERQIAVKKEESTHVYSDR